MSEPLKVVHDPEENNRLTAIGEKINALLAEADVGGFVILQGKNTAHYRAFLQPSWSCLTYERGEDGAVGVSFKAAMATGGPSEKERATMTMGMLISLANQLATHADQLAKMAAYFGRHFGSVEHIEEKIKDD